MGSVILPGSGVKTGTIKAIVSSYEDREKIITEIDLLEKQVQKGRLPRRRYKIRRRMLEGQLARISRDLVDLKQKVKSAGPKFANIMGELEVAEAELRGVEAETRRVEAQYRRGELSLDAYKRLQDQNMKRRERGKSIIDGALLRLSEGIT
jgi:chromosome segregation ATPase